MGSENKDPLKSIFEEPVKSGPGPSDGEVVAKKRVRRRIREIPEYYFLPRRSLPFTILTGAASIAAGIGAGMLIEVWIKKKVEEDGGIIWDFDKKSRDK